MGTAFVSETFEDCDKKELIRQVEQMCQQAGYESGHLYSGGFGSKIGYGVTFFDKPHTSICEANEFLSLTLDKYGPIGIVPVVEVVPTARMAAHDKKLKALGDALHALRLTVQNGFARDVMARVKSGKSVFRTCKHCQSKLAVAFLPEYSSSCPVCGIAGYLFTDTDTTRLEALKQKQAAMDIKIKEMEAKRVDMLKEVLSEGGDNIFRFKKLTWVVGANCPS